MRLLVGAGVLTLLGACNAGTEHYGDPWAPVDGDADSDTDSDVDRDADEDPEVDADGDEPEADGDLPSGGGPLTLVGSEAELITDRLCDLDGDGDMDNAFAELGSPTGDLMVMALNTALVEGLRGETPRIIHFPWVDDLSGPHDDDAILVSVEGIDSDEPADPTDDFDGEEFWIDADGLDACGEPVYYLEGVVLRDGVLDATAAVGDFPLLPGMETRGARVEGTIDPGGVSGLLLACAYATIELLGTQEAPEVTGDLTLLELFLAGGDAVGVPMMPGCSPDLDLDHDGLERFTLDDTHRIAQCVDGDLSVIDGRDCWMDPRMADGYSLNVRIVGVAATILGRQPGWEDDVDGTCEDPPDTSVLDPR